MNLRFRKYSWQLAPGQVREIRERVFIREQSVPPDLEWDDTDEIADHYLAVLADNTPVATARLFSTLEETAHIGRMAVLPEYRDQGFGAALLQHLIRDNAHRYPRFELSAQIQAIGFYQRCGFHVCSDTYEDAGIPHVDMRCLAPLALVSALDEQDRGPAPLVLGMDKRPWRFVSEPELIPLLDTVAGQASRRIWIYDRLLEHSVYDRATLRQILSDLARSHRASEVRILIHDDKPLVKRRHEFVQLIRRLPSHITLKLVNPDYPFEDTAFLLADSEGLVYRHDATQPAGFAGFTHAGRVRQLAESYQRMWEVARPSVELRDLPL